MAIIRFFTKHTLAAAFGAILLAATAIPGQAQPLSPTSAMKFPVTPEDVEAAKPNPQAPGFRLPFPPLDQMDPDMRKQFEQDSNGLHTPVGDRVPLILTPEVKAALNQVLPALRKTQMPPEVYELTILMVARDWGAQLEWWIHGPNAVKAGLPADAVEAIRLGKTPKFTTPTQEAAYQYLLELLRDHKVSDATYAKLLALIGPRQMVELTTLAGYYTNVSMMMVAHGIPIPSTVTPPLPALAVRFPK
jgi:4-carboxymuconolactone decarboxylase